MTKHINKNNQTVELMNKVHLYKYILNNTYMDLQQSPHTKGNEHTQVLMGKIKTLFDKLLNSENSGFEKIFLFIKSAYTLRHIVPVYFLKLLGERIGHYIVNTACTQIKLHLEGKLENAILLAWTTGHCNLALQKFWLRHMQMPDWAHLAYSFCKITEPYQFMSIDVYADEIIDYRYYYAQNLVQFDFSEEEHALANQELQRIGIDSNKPRVCFLGRDSAYLNTAHPQDNKNAWAYHDIRNMEISDFFPTMHYFAKNNIYSIRLGNIVEHAIESVSPYIIDISNGRVHELLDFYLPAHCDLMIAVSSGVVDAALLKNVPILCVNFNIYTCMYDSLSNVTNIFKKYYSEDEKRYLPFEYVIVNGIDRFTLEKCAEHNISVHNNTPEEILAAAMETWKRIQGTFPTTDIQEEYDAIQERYRYILDKYPEKRASSDYISPHKALSSIPLSFIRQNPWFLE